VETNDILLFPPGEKGWWAFYNLNKKTNVPE
jgi:hypothetical protein